MTEAPGKWQRLVAPTADKLGLPGKMGVELHLQPKDSMAAAELINSMARLLDVHETRQHASDLRMIFIFVIVIAVLVVAL